MPSRKVGRYELCTELAFGGMATVYLARATGPAGFEKLVALKCVHPRLARDRGFIEMFLDEARIAARINHPNVGSVFDVGEQAGVFYLAMDYLHGESVAMLLQTVASRPDERLSPRLPMHAAAIFAAACEGLHAAHELTGDDGQLLQVVHRDVSPQNLFVTYDGGVRVVDFGIARAAGRLHKTLSGVIKGKIAYMSPQQLAGDEVDRTTDIWAMGISLWELLTCRRLFKGDNQAETMTAVLGAVVPPPSIHNPAVPPELDAIVTRATSRMPADRHRTARELGRELRHFIASRGEVVGMPELSEWMERLFAVERDRKRQLIDRARRGDVVGDLADPGRLSPEPVPTVSTVVPRVGTAAGLDEASSPNEGTTAVSDARPTVEPAARAARAAHGATATPRGGDSAVLRDAPAPFTPTESVVLPVRRGRRAGLIVAAVGGVAALALAAVVVVSLGGADGLGGSVPSSTSTDSPGAEPSPAAAPSSMVVDRPPDPAPPAQVPGEPHAAPSVPVADDDSPANPPRPDRASREIRRRDPGVQTGRTASRVADPDTRPAVPVPEAPREVAAPGQIFVGVRGGWGSILVDGQPMGQTPRQLTVPAGTHRVEIRPFGTGAPERRTVVVEPGRSQRIVIDAPGGP